MNAIEEFKSKELFYEFLPIIREKFNSNEPIVSIIIDCYYGLDLVKQSIQSLLNQDYTDFILVISDNNSTDRTSEICMQNHWKYYRIFSNTMQTIENTTKY